MKAGILFGGFGGVEIGMMSAGVMPVWSIEYDPQIAAVAQGNLKHKVIVADVLDVAPYTVESVDILHASPPCPNFSQAKANGKEAALDIALATKIAQFVKILKPRIFTLENVRMYRKSQSWQIIRDALYEAGYWMDVANVNTADLGVPQTRKRMIVRAIQGCMVPYLPEPEPWQGWYQAIEDLIPDLPDSQFAPWQVARLPDELKTFLLMTGNTNTYDFDCHPGKGALTVHQPANTVTSQIPKALIVGGQYQTPNNGNDRVVQNKTPDSPIWTITANEHGDTRAWLSQGRIVAMTPRALARFQSFPDWHSLPDSNTLACRGIGNAYPPLAYQKIIAGLVSAAGGNR